VKLGIGEDSISLVYECDEQGNIVRIIFYVNDEEDEEGVIFLCQRPLFSLDFNLYVISRLQEFIGFGQGFLLNEIYLQLPTEDNKILSSILRLCQKK